MTKHTKERDFLLVGLTGSIASGKSTVCNLLEDQEIAIIDADKLARQVMSPEHQSYSELLKIIPKEVVNQDKSINRQKLAKLFYTEPHYKEKIENLVHPEIRKLFELRLKELKKDFPVVVYQIPLLFEKKIHQQINFDLLVSVIVDPDTAISRAMKRDNKDSAFIRKILSHQVDNNFRSSHSDYLIDNNGTPEDLAREVTELKQLIKSRIRKPANGTP